MTPQRVLILLNRRSGTLANSQAGDEEELIRSGFASAGLDVEVRQADPPHARRQVDQARQAGFTAIVVGGGDGTVNAIANAVAGTDLAFGVLPLGTHNHFAKEIGVATALPQAVAQVAAALTAGSVRPLDVAEVNGVMLLNFSGVGLHPQLVEEREVQHKQMRRFVVVRNLLRKFTKPLSMAVAFMWSLRRIRVLRLVIEIDGRHFARTTPAIVIGNNVHQIDAFGLSDLSVCRRDVLNVYIARVRRPIGVLRLVLAAATRSLGAMREFECIATDELTIRYHRPSLKVSVDGEVMQLRTPLRYRIRKCCLRVIWPGDVPGERK